MMESPPLFNSVEDECRYWKERAKLYHKEWTDVKQEYDEYVEQSREMEAEMDATIDQKQATIKDLRFKLSSVEKENESLKIKLESHSMELNSIEKQLENMKKERDSMKDTCDNLKQELNVKTRYTSTNGTQNGGLVVGSGSEVTTPNGINGDIMLQSHDTAALNNTNTLGTTNNTATNINDYQLQQRKPFADPDNLLNGNAMTASSRTTAFNIVTDMLRKLNLDKALLCPQCDRFSCICERTKVNTTTNSTTFSSTNKTSKANNDDTQMSSVSEDAPDNNNVLLRRSTSRSNTSLNFGSNIFKRFAERMSSNNNIFAAL
ncbi:nuclear distribution protein nudE-like 1 [Lucilia sericata]|uniref:nuclear distribution protein nudE-like 1 n=1 Tax=Lucilia sericata TaxID=13632 RepID=UPI0018A84115|nr:nuclear distribution protein nudE-like 1 [Lucilia sericata]